MEPRAEPKRGSGSGVRRPVRPTGAGAGLVMLVGVVPWVIVGAGSAGSTAAAVPGARGATVPGPSTGGEAIPLGPAADRPGAAVADSGQAGRHVFTRPLMGTEFRLVLIADDGANAKEAADLAFARIAGLEDVLSDYDPGSELSRLSAAAGRGAAVPVTDDLWRVVWAAKEWAERTDGAFDPTVGPLTRLWRRAARRGSVPSPAEIEEARDLVGHDGLTLDPHDRAVALEAPGMRLDVGGLGKGFAADEALALLASLGFDRALVDAGGDVVAGAPPPGEEGWRVAVPGAGPGGREAGCVLPLAGAALATSGAGSRSVEVDGVRHSHVLDPRTGAALTHRRIVTVLAPTGLEADVLASALSVLEPREGRALLEATPGAAARVLEGDGGGLPLATSRGSGPPSTRPSPPGRDPGGLRAFPTPDCSPHPSDQEALRP